MEIFLASAGSYPRIGDQPKQQRLRKVYGLLERGEIAAEAFEKVEQSADRILELADVEDHVVRVACLSPV